MPRGRKSENPKRRITIYLPAEQVKNIKIQSAIADKDMSALISEILEKAGITSKPRKSSGD